MNIRKRSALGLLFVLFVFCAHAQDDNCELTLSRAFDEFNNGHFYTISSILNPCIDRFTDEQKQRAFLLLTQAYLLLNDPIGAKQSYLSLLAANPEFQTDTAVHPMDVVYLGKKFTATPVFSWFAKLGSNMALPRVIHDLSAFAEEAVDERYVLRAGYQAGLGADYHYSEKWGLRAEINYAFMTFRHETRNYWQQDLKQNIERHNWISTPLTITYGDCIGKYRPYVYLGYAFQYLLSAKSIVTTKNNRPVFTTSGEEADRVAVEEESPIFSITSRRNRFNHALIAGAGVKVKVDFDYIFFDVRYTFGLKNITSMEKLYGNYTSGPAINDEIIESFEPSMRFGDVGDMFRLDNLSVSFGFLRPLYKPRALKH